MEKIRKTKPDEYKCIGCGLIDLTNEYIKDHKDKRSWICTDCLIKYTNEALRRLKPSLSVGVLIDKIDRRALELKDKENGKPAKGLGKYL